MHHPPNSSLATAPAAARRSIHAALPGVLALGVMLGLAGCSGTGQLNFVSLNLQSVDPPAPRVVSYSPQRCFTWEEPPGEVNIAARYENVAWFSPLQKITLTLSLVLDGPPAGSGRDYAVGTRELRACFDSVAEQHRLISRSGVVALTRRPGGGYRGSFRIVLSHYTGGLSTLSLLPRQPGLLLFFGTFDAVPDATRGPPLRAETESAGWTRPPRRERDTPIIQAVPLPATTAPAEVVPTAPVHAPPARRL
ncbi:MAG: hypothetical protein U1A27_09715 [Phycisphaerae bacterium]